MQIHFATILLVLVIFPSTASHAQKQVTSVQICSETEATNQKKECTFIFAAATRDEAMANFLHAIDEVKNSRVLLAHPMTTPPLATMTASPPPHLNDETIGGSLSFGLGHGPTGGPGTKLGIIGFEQFQFLDAIWGLELMKTKPGYTFNTTGLLQGVFKKTIHQISETVSGTGSYNLIWRTHGYRNTNNSIDQSSLAPQDQGAWAEKHYSDWTVGFGLGYALLIPNGKIYLQAGFFHESREMKINLHDNPMQRPGSKYEYQNFSENRNGRMVSLSYSGKRWVVGFEVNRNTKRKSYLIMGDYENDGVYDYGQNGVYENDYEYGYFYDNRRTYVGHTYGMVKVSKGNRSPWVGLEISNIGHSPARLDFKEFQSQLPSDAQFRVRVIVPFYRRSN